MRIKILILCLIGLMPVRNNDLKMFISLTNRQIIYVNNYQALSDQVKQEYVNECPELILLLFSSKGKRISANAWSKSDFYKYSRNQLKVNWKNKIVCVLVHNDLILWE